MAPTAASELHDAVGRAPERCPREYIVDHGAPALAHTAATAEAIRVLVKSAARQWGANGTTVNCIAVAPQLFGRVEQGHSPALGTFTPEPEAATVRTWTSPTGTRPATSTAPWR